MAAAASSSSTHRGPFSTPLSLCASPATVLSLSKLLLLLIANIPFLQASPLYQGFRVLAEDAEEGKPADDPGLWIYLAVAVGLVLLGGAFAGLTIALMGQDEIYLQVIRTSGEGAERKHAARVLNLLSKGKHWVLVTLLLSNVITNETLPIVLDRSLGGGWPAVLGSTVLIVIFGEIIPQSICVRYGLPIGAWMSSLVLVLMYILAPVAWPTAKLLDKLLGKDHGTVYKKAGLKTLVTLHKTLGAAGEQLNSDEVTIISAVLDLKEKPVGSIMTPMEDVFTMSADTVLDEKTMDRILSAGYSRIPIHAPDNKNNFVGMLLVKILITYDPEDCKRVRDFALATLPETSAETSCLDIVNFFQEGKSHMVLVSEYPGEDTGALGVVTLEDVIEELIGEEIIDESDVFIDVHKAIRRMAPAPRTRVPKGDIVIEPPLQMEEDKAEEDSKDQGNGESQLLQKALRRTVSEAPAARARSNSLQNDSPKTTFILRRPSGTSGALEGDTYKKRVETPEILEHLKHLGPSNLASKPRQTRFHAVKIKPGGGGSQLVSIDPINIDGLSTSAPKTSIPQRSTTGGVGEGLVGSAGRDAKDGIHALQVGYGTIGSPKHRRSSDTTDKGTQVRPERLQAPSPTRGASQTSVKTAASSKSADTRDDKGKLAPSGSAGRGARSGSITENVIESGGIKKVVLETTSSSEEGQSGGNSAEPENDPQEDKASKKKRRKKRKKPGQTEFTPLLEGDGDA